MRSRAFRRAQQQRMTNKALRHLPWVETRQDAKKVANNMRVCSCHLCTNHDTPTLSTMRHDVSANQQMEDLYARSSTTAT